MQPHQRQLNAAHFSVCMTKIADLIIAADILTCHKHRCINNTTMAPLCLIKQRHSDNEPAVNNNSDSEGARGVLCLFTPVLFHTNS